MRKVGQRRFETCCRCWYAGVVGGLLTLGQSSRSACQLISGDLVTRAGYRDQDIIFLIATRMPKMSFDNGLNVSMGNMGGHA